MTGKAACNNHDAKNMMSPKETRSYSCNIYGSLKYCSLIYYRIEEKEEETKKTQKEEERHYKICVQKNRNKH